jgi:hypothetical protein
MLKAFEHWFGPYPFYEDSYKLVEAPYLGWNIKVQLPMEMALKRISRKGFAEAGVWA